MQSLIICPWCISSSILAHISVMVHRSGRGGRGEKRVESISPGVMPHKRYVVSNIFLVESNNEYRTRNTECRMPKDKKTS